LQRLLCRSRVELQTAGPEGGRLVVLAGRCAEIGDDDVPFGGVAGGGERENVGFVVDDDRVQVGVDALQQCTVACGGLAAQFVQKCLGCRGHGGRGETDRHVVQDAWLAGS
jgi:hypothetical protein